MMKNWCFGKPNIECDSSCSQKNACLKDFLNRKYAAPQSPKERKKNPTPEGIFWLKKERE